MTEGSDTSQPSTAPEDSGSGVTLIPADVQAAESEQM